MMRNLRVHLGGLVALVLLALGTAEAAPRLEQKTVPGYHFFYGAYAMPLAELQQKSEGIAQTMALTIAKETRTEYYGAFTYLMDNLEGASLQNVNVKMGWPVRAEATPVKSFQSMQLPDFKCAYKVHQGPESSLMSAWLALYEEARAQGLKPTGKGRTLIKVHSSGYVVAELQLGIQ